MRKRLLSSLVLATVTAATLSIPTSEAASRRAGDSPSGPDARAGRAGATPFARVYLALRGCTSCSHCRTTIRQMARSASDGAEARVTTDAVEVRYSKPTSIRLREVIERLAENRLHDLKLVDVLFDADGTIANDAHGAPTFTLRGTEQSFALALSPSLATTQRGVPVRLTAVVEGWREKGNLKLVAREVRRASRA